MTIDFDTLPTPEPSSRNGFSRNPLIRDSENRDENSLAKALEKPTARLHLFAGGQVILNEGEVAKSSFSLQEAEEFNIRLDQAVLLGESKSGPRIAVPVGIDTDDLEAPWMAIDLRGLLYSSGVDDGDTSVIAQAGSLLHWHRTNRFCGKCGHASATKIGGYRRECPACDHTIFPRTDPVVIMLAERNDKCLLGRNHSFPENWYSTLAGFVEPGETMEDAVRRETYEESGIRIERVKYHASQPWPFPHSLMIGVHCEAISDKITVDDSELEDCRWFSRAEVRLMIDEKHPDGLVCPPNKSISSLLVSDWVES